MRSDKETITYSESIWKRARSGVLIMVFIHFILGVLLVVIANGLMTGNYTLNGLCILFNWWISKVIVKIVAENKTVQKPRRLGIIASGSWIVLTTAVSSITG